MAELVYSVVMALDSVEVRADIEIGGLDQLLNMQMCRRVMDNAGQRPEVVIATPLIEGTDGTGGKMSKSKGNYIALSAAATDIFGKVMSIPDRVVPGWLAALTELRDDEIEALAAEHPMRVKTLLATDVTATIHGAVAAAQAAEAFTAQFSRRRLSELPDVPVIERSELAGSTVADLFVRATTLIGSANQVRRVAAGGGLRIVTETMSYGRQSITLADANRPVLDVVPAADGPTRTFVKCGRAVVELR